MKTLYSRLARAGFAKGYVRNVVLPEWWDDAAAGSPAGLAEAMLTIAKHTGLDYASLGASSENARLRATAGVRFKRAESTSEDELRLSSSVAMRAAELAALAARESELVVPANAQALRGEILASGAPWVSLDALLEACWGAGIPVLHLAQLPPKAKKMDGMVAIINGRPVIVVARQERATAWLAFIVAHELGHVVLGHVRDAQSIVDLKIQRPEEQAPDDEERDASAFAIELLCGDQGTKFTAERRWPSAPALARAAQDIGRRQAIDPGHIALNFGYTMDLFPLARAALKLIEPGADAPRRIRTKMVEKLDWNALPPDSARFLSRLSGTNDADADP